MKIPRSKKHSESDGYLDGQLLVAMPAMSDKRFAKAVIYICAHSQEGAMGLIINQRASHISFTDLLDRLSIAPKAAEDGFPNEVLSMSIHIGGPVETGRGFVLHSADYHAADSTLTIEDGICLTATIDILKAIASGEGPGHSILALGYAGWSPGQLESEISANGWLNCPADLALVFDPDVESKYHRALAKIGIDPSHLVNEAGHA